MTKVREGYKETEIGVIPEDWDVVTVNDIADKKDKRSLTGGPFGSDLKSNYYTSEGIRIIQLQNIGEGKFDNDSKIYTSKQKADELFNCNIFPNEILIAKMADPVARACKVPEFCQRYLMCSDGIRLKVDEKDNSVDYCMYAINSSYFRKKAIENSTGTTRLRIGLSALKKLKVAKPTLHEQQRIAEILSNTDEHIEKLDKTIEDYQLLKKGMMRKLLTEGIGNTEFKETKIGRIPKDWEVKELKAISKFIKDGSHASHKDVEDGIPLLSAKDIINNKIQIPNDCRRISQEDYNKIHKNYELGIGDILLTIVGTIGRIAVVDRNKEKFTFQRSVAIIRPNVDIEANYLMQFFNGDLFQKQLKNSVNASAQGGIYLKVLNGLRIVIPPISEQKQIAAILSELDNKIETYQKQREDLIQLKKGLMQKLLTGEIRVN